MHSGSQTAWFHCQPGCVQEDQILVEQGNQLLLLDLILFSARSILTALLCMHHIRLKYILTPLSLIRQELVAWLNNLLQLNLTKVEQCGTGYAHHPSSRGLALSASTTAATLAQ